MTSVIELPDATHLGLFTNRDEWLKVRESGIGGSEVAVICGLSKWESPYTLWCKKTGRIESPDISDREPVEWGNRLEPVIIDKFADTHPELTVHRDCGTYANKERPWQRANPDAIYELPDGKYGVLEIKTAQFEDDWQEGIPRYYYTQVQWYMQALGLGEGILAVLFHGNKYREFPIVANKLEQDVNLSQVQLFCEYLEHDTPPDFDGADSTYETVRQLNPLIDPEQSVEIEELGVEYMQLDQQSKQAYAKLQELKTRIMNAMGQAKTATVYGKATFTRSSRGPEGVPYLQVKKGKVE